MYGQNNQENISTANAVRSTGITNFAQDYDGSPRADRPRRGCVVAMGVQIAA
jgi:hypothetical protein